MGEALALESTAAAHCTKGAILQQLALAKGPDEASAVPADGEWARLVDAAIAEQRRAMELEPSAQEPREYLKALLRLRGIEESVPDAADSYRPAPQPAAAAATASTGSPDDGRYPEGWLHKKGGLKDGERNWIKGGRRNWKVRWFSFDGSTIRWFESKGGKELGNLAVGPQCAVEIDEENRNKFCVRSERRDLHCKADDESQAVEWCVSQLPAQRVQCCGLDLGWADAICAFSQGLGDWLVDIITRDRQLTMRSYAQFISPPGA